MKGLAGKTVLITAGGAGIGRCMAERFAAEGAEVAICDADAGAVATVQKDCPKIMASVVDVTDEVALAEFTHKVETQFGGIDVLCANAGIGGPAGAIEDLDLVDWRACLSVNLDGAFLACKAAVPGMKARGAGTVLLTSSTAGLFGYPYRAPYAAAKWAVIGLMKTLAMELGPHGIRVNALCPGAVEGPRMDRVLGKEAQARGMAVEDVRQIYVKGVSLKTWVTADEVADMALFLASDMGAKISGQAMSIDGHTETLGD